MSGVGMSDDDTFFALVDERDRVTVSLRNHDPDIVGTVQAANALGMVVVGTRWDSTAKVTVAVPWSAVSTVTVH